MVVFTQDMQDVQCQCECLSDGGFTQDMQDVQCQCECLSDGGFFIGHAGCAV